MILLGFPFPGAGAGVTRVVAGVQLTLGPVTGLCFDVSCWSSQPKLSSSVVVLTSYSPSVVLSWHSGTQGRGGCVQLGFPTPAESLNGLHPFLVSSASVLAASCRCSWRRAVVHSWDCRGQLNSPKAHTCLLYSLEHCAPPSAVNAPPVKPLSGLHCSGSDQQLISEARVSHSL